MNSPWGHRGAILQQFGWTYKYLCREISWANVQLMLADQPKHLSEEEAKERRRELNKVKVESFEDAEAAFQEMFKF